MVAIVPGDSDSVNFFKARGVRVEVYSFPYSTAEELRHAAKFYQMGPDVVMNPQRPLVRPLDDADSGGNSYPFGGATNQFDGEADFFIEAVK